MKISIGNDHAGTEYKQAILKRLQEKGVTVINYGTDTLDSVDYPDFVHPVAEDVENENVDFGILICGNTSTRAGDGASSSHPGLVPSAFFSLFQGIKEISCLI